MPVNASIVTALAIHETIVKYLPDHKQDVKLKWINDVFIQGKKVSGVLVACQNGHFKSGKPCFRLDIGIGVNLNSSPLEGSACLKDLKGEAIDVDQFVDLLCINVVKKFRQLDEEGFSRAN